MNQEEIDAIKRIKEELNKPNEPTYLSPDYVFENGTFVMSPKRIYNDNELPQHDYGLKPLTVYPKMFNGNDVKILLNLVENSIPKQKIRDKIEELDNEFHKKIQDNDSFYFDYSNEYAHIEEVLKELLED